LPLPRHSTLLLAGFDSLENAIHAVTGIRRSGLEPAAVELIGQGALQITRAYLKESFPLMEETIRAHLLVELRAAEESVLNNEIERITGVLAEYTSQDIFSGSTSQEKEKLWKIRRTIGQALKSQHTLYRDIDVCIPLTFLSRYISGVEEICKKGNVSVVCFGHVMDGNLHTMLLLEKGESYDTDQYTAVLHKIYDFAISNGGVISGEHGIGYLQREFMPMQFPASSLRLMKDIKAVFDPEGIMNPGKVI
jgi:glycolate oxidase